jgi:2-octaprenylphenol hydroxylase
MLSERFDLIIVGSGLAGSALACALADLDLRIALLEARPLSLQTPPLRDTIDGFDLRVSAITPASQQWLEQLGAWQRIARLSPYRHMTVWDANGVGSIEFDASEVNAAQLGHIVENGLLQQALLQQLSTSRAIQLIAPATVELFARDGEQIALELASGRRLTASLLIGADGAQSSVREWAGIGLREWDYNHRGIVATIAAEKPHGATARQIFREDGPLALLPLRSGDGGEHLCSIVWSCEPGRAGELLALDDSAFAAALTQASEQVLGRITAVSPRQAFPLRARHARSYTAPGIALIGDAAHTIHPLAGLGINLGFRDARALAGEIRRAVARQLPLSEPSLLARYQRARIGDNWLMLGAMEGFKRLFGTQAALPVLLRNRGLDLVNRSGALKRAFINHAIGG